MSETKTVAVKKPQDRKPKKGEFIKVTVRDHTVLVDPEALNDLELLDELNTLDSGNGLVLPSVLRRLVGDQYKALLEAIRDPETGRVTGEAGAEFVRDILGAFPNS